MEEHMAHTMEEHMAQTLIEIDNRIPDALRLAFGTSRGSLDLSPDQQVEVANFAAVLLAPLDATAAASDDPMDCDDEAEEEPDDQDLGMVFASSYIKHHDEDAHFGHAEAGVIGVADGVGAYRGQGVDAAAFSRRLMHSAYEEVATAVPGTRFCPLALLERAHEETVAARTPAASTAAIVSLAGRRSRRTLKWAYVGDSGLVVLRDGRVLRRSQPQQHYFNCPYQLRSSPGGKTPADAAVGEVAAREGDVVVLGTDGLFDNVFDGEIERIVRMGTALGFAPENMAEVIAAFAYEAASCGDRDTPFCCSSRAQPGKPFFTGGKRDDITVVVAYIVPCPSRSQM